jgi:hypothetical protein
MCLKVVDTRRAFQVIVRIDWLNSERVGIDAYS